MKRTVWTTIISGISGVLLGLIVSRLLYEAFFPLMAWSGRPWGALLWALVGAGLTSLTSKKIGWWVWLPLWLNLLWLLTPAVDILQSRLIFGGTLWLVGVTAALNNTVIAPSDKRWWQRSTVWLLLALIPLYGLTLGQTVGMHDTFEFQVVIPKLGIVHATGYPLYLLLGKVWTFLIPFGSIAWRINIGTAVYALLTAVLLYRLMLNLIAQIGGENKTSPLLQTIALSTALLFAITPTFWSQAVEAEVYTLHNLFVVAALNLALALHASASRAQSTQMAVLLGLGLTNHLTTLFLAPAAVWVYLSNQDNTLSRKIVWLKWVIPAGLAPLILYAYLPLRWQAVNDEPMGLGRFWQWVSGGQFQDALQWWAWWRDTTRYEVVGRLFLAEWPVYLLVLALGGLIYLFYANWRIALIFLITWVGYTFYCLNYYVPDLNVFLLPAQLIIAVWLGIGLYGMQQAINRLTPSNPIWGMWPLLLILLTLPQIASRYETVDRSAENPLVVWGEGVLAQELTAGSTILADSEKIAPLFYLQQAEGVRPDLDIKVLFTEGEYRQVLDERVAQGETVYLARFLPNLAGQYHLRSAGPLTEVSRHPLTQLPDEVTPTSIDFGEIQLIGVALAPQAAIDPQAAAITLYWTADQATEQALQLYMRWAGGQPINPAGVHPANDDYPTVAWRNGEIVPDFHLLPIPNHPPATLPIEVAFAPAFTPADQLVWQEVAVADFSTHTVTTLDHLPNRHLIRAFWEDGNTLTTAAYPDQIRPQAQFSVASSGAGSNSIQFELKSSEQGETPTADQLLPQGAYQVVARREGKTAVCGWLQPTQDRCVIGSIQVSGVPLPAGATNFADLIALRQIRIENSTLQPGSSLPLTIEWQALAPIPDDYTVFVQILTEDDQLVGQVDSWPLQGTLPTSSWRPSQQITDPYTIPLSADLPSGNYRLIVGFYRLSDLQRLSVLDARGRPLDDKFEVEGLIVP